MKIMLRYILLVGVFSLLTLPIALASEPNLEIVPTGQRLTEIRAAALSGDGKRLLIAGVDNSVRLWDSETGVKLQTIDTVGNETVIDLALSEDGKRALTTSSYPGAILWDIETGTELFRLARSYKRTNKATLSGNGKRVLIGYPEGTGYPGGAVLWDAETGHEIRGLRPEQIDLKGDHNYITALALSGDGKRAIISTLSGTWLIESETDKVLKRLTNHDNSLRDAALSSDGSRLLTNSSEGTVSLWDTETGAKLRAFGGRGKRIRSIAFSGDGKRALTASEDGTTHLWDAQNGKELCSILSLDYGKELFVFTPEGLFDGSINATRFVSCRIAGTTEFVPLERYHRKYHQPGLLALLAKGDQTQPQVNIAQALPPKVRITYPTGSGTEVKDGRLELRAAAESRGEHPVTQLHLRVDGRPYRGQLGQFRVENPNLGQVTAQWTIELEPGPHKLKVLADTAYAQGASEEIDIRYLGGQRATGIDLPVLYVLAVGISKYPGDLKLDYAAHDAEAIVQAYQQHSKPLFQKIEVKLLTDTAANRTGCFSGLRWLRENMTQRDFGVVFFAGHGEKDKEGSLYFLPVDVDKQDLAGSAIDADQLKKQLAGIPGRLQLMLDACHAGKIGDGKPRSGRGLTDDLLRDLIAEESGLIVMCSATGREVAQESHEHRHGIFTVAILEALEGKAEKSKDGAVYLTALDAYVTKRVKELSKGQQHAVTVKPAVRDFPVSRP